MEPRGNLHPLGKRLMVLGIAVAVAGLALAGVGLLYGFPIADDGLDSAQAMYEAQGVTLSYNEDGQLVDRGNPEGAEKILALLEGEWKFPVNRANLDADDPLVNTRDELMYEYATITYHVLHGEKAVVLTAADVPITYRGVTYSEPGTYNIAPLKYYAELDRSNPIEKQLRDAWTPQALGLLAMLSAGHANQAAGELATMTSLGMGGIGLIFVAAGGGLAWAGFGVRKEPQVVARPQGAPQAVPAAQRGPRPVATGNVAANPAQPVRQAPPLHQTVVVQVPARRR